MLRTFLVRAGRNLKRRPVASGAPGGEPKSGMPAETYEAAHAQPGFEQRRVSKVSGPSPHCVAIGSSYFALALGRAAL